MPRISEGEIVLPALFLMSISPNGKITTSELIEKLMEILKPQGEDLEILAGRRDTKFSQKVRNLKSHNTFERLNYAEYRNGCFVINDNGRRYVQDNIDIIKYLLSNDFNWNDLRTGFERAFERTRGGEKIEPVDENIIIEEGTKRIIERAIYERSMKLRNIAIESFYSRNGAIFCEICFFNFEKFYGDLGKGYIEVHHRKPIFKFESEDFSKFLNEALNDTALVCSNCHRIIHRDRKSPLDIGLLKENIAFDFSQWMH